MNADQTIDYESMAQDALRGLVRSVLQRVVKHGLPGEHHFYIAFNTQAPGVSISKRLMEKYPEEMTIVMQHRFWDLHVSQERFELKLTFDSIPERLVVPYSALKVFFDPSVPYGLQFEDSDQDVGLIAGHGSHAAGQSNDGDETVTSRLSVVDDKKSEQQGTYTHLKSMDTITPEKRKSRRDASQEDTAADGEHTAPEALPASAKGARSIDDAAAQVDADDVDVRPEPTATPRKITETVPAVERKSGSRRKAATANTLENGQDAGTGDTGDLSDVEMEELEAGELEALEIQGVADAKVVSLDAFRKK